MKAGINLLSRAGAAADHKAFVEAVVDEATTVFGGNIANASDETAEMLCQAFYAGGILVYQRMVKGVGAERKQERRFAALDYANARWLKRNPGARRRPRAKELRSDFDKKSPTDRGMDLKSFDNLVSDWRRARRSIVAQ